ncbi:MAG: hypothetical protein ACR2PC_03605 [Tsuneonella suprasediminis]
MAKVTVIVRQKGWEPAMNEAIKGAVIVGVITVAVVVLWGSDFFGDKHTNVKKAVSEHLRDPLSAQFRNLKESKTATCGEVNGKNAFGSYSGIREFVYRNGVVLFEPEEPASFDVQESTTFYKQQAQFFRLKRECVS